MGNQSTLEKDRKLQELLFPRESIAEDVHLYYQPKGEVYQNEENVLELKKGSEVDFNAYFNAFSANKWYRYTDVREVSLVLKYGGAVEVALYRNRILYGRMEEELIRVRRVYSDEAEYGCFDFGKISGVGNLSFKVRAISDTSFIYGGFYASNQMCAYRDIKLAVIFCTYCREEYVKRNVDELSKKNDDTIIYVVDNARSLNQEDFKKACRLVGNKNAGGAGGFSRGMIQVIRDQPKEQFTHFILMDDDVLLDARILTRLKFFLSRVTGEYQKSFVGGAMLRKDMKYYQVESGANWNGGMISSNRHGLDMRNSYNCLLNELDTRTEYNAWWFCTVPIEYLREDNLPLPIFFCNDDVDYGLRNQAHVITMNGICTWHDPFESKLSAMRLYYENRNRLIVNSVHGMSVSTRQIIRSLKNAVRDEIYLYRYQNVRTILLGVEDFLKGPDWLCALDAEEYNKEILLHNRKMEFMEALGAVLDYDWYRTCCTIGDCDWLHKWIRLSTLNGLLLKANRTVTLPLYAKRPVQAYRAAEILYYDEVTNKGYLARKDWRKIRECWSLYRKVKKKIRKSYTSAAAEYRSRYSYLTSLEMWEGYLK